MNRAERIKSETRALWIELFGEPPAPDLDASRMMDLLLQQLEPKGYSRLSQASRARNLVFPDQPA